MFRWSTCLLVDRYTRIEGGNLQTRFQDVVSAVKLRVPYRAALSGSSFNVGADILPIPVPEKSCEAVIVLSPCPDTRQRRPFPASISRART
jgi:hypothetical protein